MMIKPNNNAVYRFCKEEHCHCSSRCSVRVVAVEGEHAWVKNLVPSPWEGGYVVDIMELEEIDGEV